MNDFVRILSENPIEQLWLYLSRLESVPLARKAILARAHSAGTALTPTLLDKKAVGVAYALRSAHDYLAAPNDSLTKRVLSGYYAMMSFLSAVLVADPASRYDLEELESATKFGHGLGSIDDESSPFPIAQKVYVTSNGFLHRYLKHIGVDPTDIKISQRFTRVDELSEADRGRLMSLDALLARVPELTEFYFEVTGRTPLAVQVFAAKRTLDTTFDTAFLRRKEPAKARWVGLRGHGFDPTAAEQITGHLGMPLTEVQLETDVPTGEVYWTGSVAIPDGLNYWHEALRLYKSPMCPSSWYRPVFERIDDPLVLHFCTLYLLSILVRYRPKLWREITEGELTEHFALLRSYLSIVDRVIPELVLGRILGRQILCALPGGLNAPL